jgi:hypothetical protein
MSLEMLSPPHALSVHETAIPAAREASLRQLLPGTDYDDAVRLGVVDMFEYNPETGEDGLVHTLAGIITPGEDGAYVLEGFHHEESGNQHWGRVPGDSRYATRVETEHLETEPGSKRRRYERFPAEPYLGQVAIGDRPKYTFVDDPKGGGKKLVRTNNTMYPQAYDGMAVLRTIQVAYEGRDPRQDQPAVSQKGEPVLVNTSSAPMIDGKTPMEIRLVMNAETGRIKTAVPIIRGSKPGAMKLTDDELRQHMTYGLASK